MIEMLQSQRLYYRELVPEDAEDMFVLDSNPEVHRYLGNKPVKDIQKIREVIAMVREQYRTNGIGRMAVLLKDTDEFIGWAGLKLDRNVNGHDRFYDIGYRLIQEHWGRGYATEANTFFIKRAFNSLKFAKLNASALTANGASCHVLEKTGLQFVETFDYDGEECRWYELLNPNL